MAGLLLGRLEPLRWGTLALMATPVSRVLVVTVGMFARRDLVFGFVSLWILAVLATSIGVALRF